MKQSIYTSSPAFFTSSLTSWFLPSWTYQAPIITLITYYLMFIHAITKMYQLIDTNIWVQWNPYWYIKLYWYQPGVIPTPNQPISYAETGWKRTYHYFKPWSWSITLSRQHLNNIRYTFYTFNYSSFAYSYEMSPMYRTMYCCYVSTMKKSELMIY